MSSAATSTKRRTACICLVRTAAAAASRTLGTARFTTTTSSSSYAFTDGGHLMGSTRYPNPPRRSAPRGLAARSAVKLVAPSLSGARSSLSPSGWAAVGVRPGSNSGAPSTGGGGGRQWRGLSFLTELGVDTPFTFRTEGILGQGRGLRPTLPPNALDSVLERLDRAHYCTAIRREQQQQQQAGQVGDHDSGQLTTTSGERQQQEQEEVVDERGLQLEHWGYALSRLPSQLPGKAHEHGLFLTAGRVPKGAVLTLYPGLIYQLPYDLECLMPYDDALLGPCPPDFVRHNRHLLRFHDHDKNQHVLVDGNPTGRSALNFLKAAAKRRGRAAGGDNKRHANLDWLDPSAVAQAQGAEAGAASHGEVTGGGDAAAGQDHGCCRIGRFFGAQLGLGHLIKDVSGRLEEDQQNVELHLCTLPASSLPPHLSRYVPNLHFSDLLGDQELYTVLVTASQDLEVGEGQPPIELLVAGVHRYGYPLR